MKSLSLTIFLVFGILVNSMAVNVAALFSYATFQSPEKGTYLETYLTVLGATVVHKKLKSGKYQGEIQVSMVFRQNDSIKAFRKINLLGPEIADTSTFQNFIDLQRIPLANGKYQLEFSISDKNNPNVKAFTSIQEVVINIAKDYVAISDIELLDSYKKAELSGPLTKSGYDMIPYVSNFYPENLDRIAFYAEIYNTKQFLGEGKCVVNSYIENYISKTRLPSFTRFSTQPTNNVNIILSEFNITELPTGSYNLVIEVRDKENKVVAEKKAFFQRKNPKAKLDIPDLLSVNVVGTFAERITNTDSLRDFIRSLRPVSAENEKEYADVQIKNADIATMQKYLYSFWFNRDQANPEAAWIAYHKQVIIANKLFSTAVNRGYSTDRGRVFLQYGPPDERVMSENEPNTYPYEIWHYYKLKDQTNKKFVFFNRDLVTNNYELLHSDAKGEIYDSRWQMKLHARTIHSPDFDIEKPGEDNFGDKSNDNFLHPK